jgi:type II secretory pathway pseudopilin PulG
MRRLMSKGIRRLAAEDGYTLVELLVASMVGLLVVGVATTVFVAAVRSQPNLTTRGNAITQARTSAERMVRELRQGKTVYTATSSQLSFLTHVPSNDSCGSASSGFCRVTYTCSSGTCTRVTAKPDGSSPGTPYTLVSGLAGNLVFGYSYGPSGPTYISINFIFPGQNGGTGISISDGAALRNAPS